MPTTYAHDLFGKKVFRRLPPQMKECIRENGELYRIGLHGPDILFYFFVSKNPVTQFGVRMHREKAGAFFEQGMAQVREKKDRRLAAYLLGFGCHYLLDSACHPFVNQTASAGTVSHTLLEKEFDRELMEDTGKNPLVFYPSRCVVPRRAHAKIIHGAIPLVRTGNIYVSLKMMKASTNAMVCDDGGRRRRILAKAAGIFGKDKSQFVLDHFMAAEAASAAAEPVKKLKALFDAAVEEAPGYLCELFSLTEKDRALSSRWDRTYNG